MNQDRAFQNHGYFETVIDALTGRVLGLRYGVTPREGRVIGCNGQEDSTITEPMVLFRGPKRITVKASAKKPLRIRTIIFPQSGPINWRHPLDR